MVGPQIYLARPSFAACWPETENDTHIVIEIGFRGVGPHS